MAFYRLSNNQKNYQKNIKEQNETFRKKRQKKHRKRHLASQKKDLAALEMRMTKILKPRESVPTVTTTTEYTTDAHGSITPFARSPEPSTRNLGPAGGGAGGYPSPLTRVSEEPSNVSNFPGLDKIDTASVRSNSSPVDPSKQSNYFSHGARGNKRMKKPPLSAGGRKSPAGRQSSPVGMRKSPAASPVPDRKLPALGPMPLGGRSPISASGKRSPLPSAPGGPPGGKRSPLPANPKNRKPKMSGEKGILWNKQNDEFKGRKPATRIDDKGDQMGAIKLYQFGKADVQVVTPSTVLKVPGRSPLSVENRDKQAIYLEDGFDDEDDLGRARFVSSASEFAIELENMDTHARQDTKHFLMDNFEAWRKDHDTDLRLLRTHPNIVNELVRLSLLFVCNLHTRLYNI